MTDIVERLRNVFPIGWEGEMRHEAADEIERLRGALHLISYAEVEARVAAAREEGRIAGFEEAMDDLRDAPPLGVNRHGVMYLSPAEVEARVAAARREGIEAALAAVDAEPEPEGEMPAKLANTDKRILVLATVRATKRGIDGRIRALLEENSHG